ncbi:hypothetical protein L6452_39207 [Arctium lappa]|uniref:Uncharacterized protein n=1 Tax=Arctium lappa TaxID=4217 RepID=A0ACB8XR59_ARCLA|nr:hypothetical protein L6452_39207 [Arctium lappa]
MGVMKSSVVMYRKSLRWVRWKDSRDLLIDVEKTEANGGSTVLNRSKKRQSKSNVGVACGKLLSQCSQLWICSGCEAILADIGYNL